MPNVTHYLRLELLANFDKLLPTIEIEDAKKHKGQSGVLGKAYAALLFSSINAGLNVATRAPIQNPAKKEDEFMETGLVAVGSYSRSERNHPSYELLKFIMPVIAEEAQALAEEDRKELNLLSEEDKAALVELNKFKEALKGEKKETWLGMYSSPEERLEHYFSLMPVRWLLAICHKVAKTMNTKYKKKSAFGEAFSPKKNFEDLFSEKHKRFSSKDFPKIEKDWTFNEVMAYRVNLAQKAAKNTGTTSENLVHVFAPKTEYPCVMFDLRNLIEALKKQALNDLKCRPAEGEPLDELKIDEFINKELKINDLGEGSNTVKGLNNLLLSYFCGVVNFYSELVYFDYIEMQSQGSFGSIRPSITDTGYSFRVSLGLVPFEYLTSFKMAIGTFLKQVTDSLKPLSELLLEDFLVRKARKAEDESDKSELDRLAHNPYRIELANAVAFKKNLVGLTPLIEKFYSVDKTNFSELVPAKPIDVAFRAQSLNVTTVVSNSGSDAPTSIIPTCLISIAIGYLNLKKDYEVYEYKAPECLGYIDNLINLVLVNLQSTVKNWCYQASYFETLLRLLQIRQEMLTVVKYSEALHTEMLEPPKLTRTLSMDSTLSDDEDDEYGTTITKPSRSGMAALTQSIKILLKTLNKKPLKFGFEEVYFEVDKEYAESVETFYSKKLDEELKNQIKTDGDEYGILDANTEVDARLIDISAFPRFKDNFSQLSPWLNQPWDTLTPKGTLILLVDVTSAQESRFDQLITLFLNQTHIPAMMVFASNNKYGQGGVDLSCMGEIRLFTLPKDKVAKEDDAYLTKLKKSYKELINHEDNGTAAMKAYRQVLQSAGLLRSSQYAYHSRKQTVSPMVAHQQNHAETLPLLAIENGNL